MTASFPDKTGMQYLNKQDQDVSTEPWCALATFIIKFLWHYYIQIRHK